MAFHADVCIIGGGVIGLTTAYFLGREGASVAVVDKGDLGRESSWAGAGIISPGNPDRARGPLGRLRAQSAAMFPALSAELLERTGIDNGYLACGGLELLQSSDEVERRRVAQVIREERQGGAFGRVLSGGELRVLEPAVADIVAGAVLFPGIAQVRNPRHVRALIAACEQLGVELKRECPVLELRRRGEKIQSATTPAGALAADRFLVAAGAWSEGLLASLGWQPGIRPIRGQIVLLRAAADLIRRILQAGGKYLVPRGDGLILAGSTEEDVGFDRRTTEEAVEGLLAFARRIVPRLADAAVERAWAGLRPGSPDGRPFLGPMPGYSNLFVAAGHFRSGIQLSPATGLLMKELLLGQPTSLPLEPFRLDRPTAVG